MEAETVINTQNNNFSQSVLDMAVKKVRTSATIWKTIGIFQIVIGIMLIIIGYGFLTIIMGIWNVVQAGKRRKNADYFQKDHSNIVNFYEAQTIMLIVFAVLNLIFGGIFGVIGSIYDLSVRGYILAHRKELN